MCLVAQLKALGILKSNLGLISVFMKFKVAWWFWTMCPPTISDCVPYHANKPVLYTLDHHIGSKYNGLKNSRYLVQPILANTLDQHTGITQSVVHSGSKRSGSKHWVKTTVGPNTKTLGQEHCVKKHWKISFKYQCGNPMCKSNLSMIRPYCLLLVSLFPLFLHFSVTPTLIQKWRKLWKKIGERE